MKKMNLIERTATKAENKYERQIAEKIMCICGMITCLPKLDEKRRERIALLARAIICGNLKELKEAMLQYAACPEDLLEDRKVLTFAFNGEDIEFLPTVIYHSENQRTKLASAANLYLLLKGSNLVLSVSTHPELASFVCKTNADGSQLQATKEEPALVAKRFAGVFSVPQFTKPPSYLGKAASF